MTVRRRAFWPVFITAVVIAAAAPAHAADPTDPSAPDGASAGGSRCTPVPVSAITYVHPDGSPAKSTDIDAAAIYHMNFGQGSDVTQVLPPASFNPLNASDAVLQLYDFPPRPHDPAGLQQWVARMSHFKSVARPGMCQTRRRNLLGQGSATSANWSGPLATDLSGEITDVAGTFQQTSFDSPCATNSGYSTWPGIGGSNTGSLLQDGTDVGQSSVNDIYAWWEALSTQYFIYETIFSGFTVNAGDTINAETDYEAGGTGKAYFTIFNLTTGQNVSTSFTTLGGYPASNYWDGTTAEFINERPTQQDGTFTPLRKPHLGTTHWTDGHLIYGPNASSASIADTAYSPTVPVSEENLTLTSDGTSSGRTIDDMRNGISSNNTWDNFWDACS